MTRLYNILVPGLVAVVLFSCEVKKVDTAEIQDEIEAREFKRITPEELTKYAREESMRIIDSLEKLENSDDKTSFLMENGAEYLEVSDTLGLDQMRKNLFEVYESSIVNGESVPDIFQPIDDNARFIFTRAYIKNDSTFSLGFLILNRKHLTLKF